MSPRVLLVPFGAALLLTVLLSSKGEAVLIDDFDGGNDAVISTFSPGPSNTAYANSVGGSRTLTILSGTGISTSLEVIGGTLNHGQTPAGGGISSVTWDANGAGLGGIDLTNGGAATGITIDIDSIDVGLVDLEFTIVGSAGSSSLSLSNLGAATHLFPFASFLGSADPTDIDSIVLEITADPNSDVTLDFVLTNEFIPEPTSLAIWSLIGLAGVVFVWRRWKR